MIKKVEGYRIPDEIEPEWIEVKTGKQVLLPDGLKVINMTTWGKKLVVCTSEGVYLMKQRKWWEFWK